MRKLYIIILSLITLLWSCDHFDDRLHYKNNSIHSIVAYCSPDTIIDSIIINKFHSKNNKLNVFFIELDTLLKYNSWEYIIRNRVFKKFNYTEEELNKKGWVIEYP